MNLLEKIKAQGWYLTEDGLKKLTKEISTEDMGKLIKEALNWDLRDMGAGALPHKPDANGFINGRIVLQIQKIRNVSAPKNNEESTAAPRFLQLELTDGLNTLQSLELERINSISMNTPPGTKLYLKSDKLQLVQGFLMLKPIDIDILGGSVEHLVEKWEVARQMQKYTRTRMLVGASGPPPWIAFGKRLDAHKDALIQDRNFKSLQAAGDKDKTSKENEGFNTMRNEAIAEAAKAGSKKVFGGGHQNILDHNVKKILDKGYSEEEAKVALKITNNNLERALYNLKRRKERNQSNVENNIRSDNMGGGGRRQRGTGNGGRNSTKDDCTTNAKPAANVSLFDFLTNKLPSASDDTNTILTNSTSATTNGSGTESSSRNQKNQQQEQCAQQNQKVHTDKVKFENNMSASFAANRSNAPTTIQQMSSSKRQTNNDRNRRPNKEDRRKSVNYNNISNTNSSSNNNSNYYPTNINNHKMDRSSKRDVEQTTRSSTSTILQSSTLNLNNKRIDYKQYNNNNTQSKQQHQKERPIRRPSHQDNKHGNSMTSNSNDNNNTNDNADKQMQNLIESTTKVKISNRRESYHHSSNNNKQDDRRRHQQSKHTNVSTTTIKQQPQKLQQPLKINSTIGSNNTSTNSSNTNANSNNNNNNNNNTNQTTYANTQQFAAKSQTITPTITAAATATGAGTPPTIITSNPQPTGFVNQLCNGLPYDPSKIVGFQSKEANEYAMNLLKSQGLTLTPSETTAVSTNCPQQQQQQQPINTTNIATIVTQPLSLPLPPAPALVAAPQMLNVTTTTPYATNAGIPAFPNMVTSQPPSSLPPPPPLTTAIPYESAPGANWPWKKGDLCLAKYWEDCKFYEAEVTDITDKTCVVLFRGYGNFEEVLKSDCLPITDAQQRTVNTYETNLTVMAATNSISIAQQQHNAPTDTATLAMGTAQLMAATQQHHHQHPPFQRHNSHHRYRSERQMYVPPHKRGANN